MLIVGHGSGFLEQSCAALLQPEREHPSHGLRLVSALGGDSVLQGAWAGNHLGITMESDRFAPVELLCKAEGKRGPAPSRKVSGA